MMQQRFRFHSCLFDPQCRSYGAPKRVYVHTPWGSLIAGESTQGWLPFVGYLDWRHRWAWWPVVWHPKYRSAKGESSDERP